MKEYNKKRRVIVDKYSNTPPFNVKSVQMVSYPQKSRSDCTKNQVKVAENQPMRLCDIKRLYAKKEKSNVTSRYNINHSTCTNTKSHSKKSLKETVIRSQNIPAPNPVSSSLTYAWQKCNEEKPVKEQPANDDDSKRYKISFTSIPSHKLMKKLLKGFITERDVVDENCVSTNVVVKSNFKLQTEHSSSPLNNKKTTITKKSKSLYTVTNLDNITLKPQCLKKSLHNLPKANVKVDDWYNRNSNLKNSSILTRPSKTTVVRNNKVSTNSKRTAITTTKDSRWTKESYGEPFNTKNEEKSSVSHPLSDEVLREIDNKYGLKFDIRNSSQKFRNVLCIGRECETKTKSSKKDLLQPKKKERCSVKNCELNDPESEESSIQTLNLCLLDEELERKTQLKITTQSVKPQNLKSTKHLKKVLRSLEHRATPATKLNPKAAELSKVNGKMSSNFSIESLRSYFENPNEESGTSVNEKLKDQNTENYELVKSTLKNFSFDKHFPQFKHALHQEDGDNMKSKSVKSLFRNTSSSTNTVASSAVSHMFKPPIVEQCRSVDVLDNSISKCCDVDESKKSNFVRQQVERLNQLMGMKQGQKGEENSEESVRGCSEVMPNKQRSKFHMNHVRTGEECTLVERIKRQVSIYKLANRAEDEEDEWSEGEEYTAHISFPKETRNAMSMLITKQASIELQEDQQVAPVVPPPPQDTELQPPSHLEVTWVPCPRNLLCNKGVHQGSCSISRRISWPGIAARVSSTTMSNNQM